MLRIFAPIFLALVSATAAAQPVSVEQAPRLPERNYVNLRAGPSTFSRRPEICLELSPHERVGVEACGTGSGFLHNDPAPEIAHFRAKLNLDGWQTKVGFVQPQLSLGFSELQLGEDGPGFNFTGVGATGVDTAGPEAGATLRLLYPVGAGFDLVGAMNLSLSYFNYAPELSAPQRPWQPTFSFTIGAGF